MKKKNKNTWFAQPTSDYVPYGSGGASLFDEPDYMSSKKRKQGFPAEFMQRDILNKLIADFESLDDVNKATNAGDDADVGTPTPQIHLPPGCRLTELSKFWFSSKTNERVFEQHLADMRIEYIAALEEGNVRKAKWVHVRGVLAYWLTIVNHLWDSSLGSVIRKIING